MKTAVIAIAIIVLAVVLYSIFAKSGTVTQTGGGGTQEQHGGILTFLTNWFHNVTVSGIGK